jgi:hypothetical protein
VYSIKRDYSKVLALSAIARAQMKAKLQSQANSTIEHALRTIKSLSEPAETSRCALGDCRGCGKLTRSNSYASRRHGMAFYWPKHDERIYSNLKHFGPKKIAVAENGSKPFNSA